MGMVKKVIIIGAAGRDFHTFNTKFKEDPDYEVVAFLATQLPGIGGRIYPPELAGPRYPNGIPIYDRAEKPLAELARELEADEAVLAYSDLEYRDVMEEAYEAFRSGLDFRLVNPLEVMLEAGRPVISVCAVRTGAGKSSVARRVARILLGKGLRPVDVRHPMPYGDLRAQVCQVFRTYEDVEAQGCTIEEREEYEPMIRMGVPVLAGVDYGEVLRAAEREGDVIIWDGGNNDLPFIKPDLHIVVADPLRPGAELRAYPGALNAMMADVLVVNKVNMADRGAVETVKRNLRELNERAPIIEAESVVEVDRPELVRGKKVLVVEDGPSVTHGHLGYGAGYVAARELGAEIVDPKPYAVGVIKEAYEKYPHMREVLPTIGYTGEQVRDLETTINAVPCDAVLLGTLCDLAKMIRIEKPVAYVRYEIREITKPDLADIIGRFLADKGLA
ncbi:GTPase [Candidatus Bathyarchaeota archaeon]|nr:MAG: GTPase [Candidatus Bathyarchaeota archaeon]